MTISVLRYCFKFFGLEYKFVNKQLIRCAYFDSKTLRSYNDRVIKPSANGYYLQGMYMNKDSIKRLLQLKEVREMADEVCPF